VRFRSASDGGDAFNYLVEIDNSTEPVYSTRQRDRNRFMEKREPFR
jgi:hypothetical protein